MSEEEMLELADKVKNNTATNEEGVKFWEAFNKLSKEVNEEVEIYKLRSHLKEL